MKNQMRALARDAEDGGGRLLVAPTVGRYFSAPPLGTFLSPDGPMGKLRVLRKGYRLLVPAGVSGVVREVLVRGRGAPVEYGQPILLVGRAADPLAAGLDEDAEPVGRADEEVAEGMVTVRSPTDGIFYRRPSPEDPAYVKEGDVIERGKVLGLVEVMKCFTQIAYAGEGEGASRARVARVLPEDAAEVKLDQLLFVLSPEH